MSSKRMLKALNHMNPDSVNLNDESNFRQLIIWIEDQKIRHYKIEDRRVLQDTNSKEWERHFREYLKSLNCPDIIEANNRPGVAHWLLGQAVSFEYSDNIEKYKKQTREILQSKKSDEPQVMNTNPLDNLDFTSSDFKEGILELCKLLKISAHPDPLVNLKAASVLVSTRLSQQAINNPGEIVPQGKPYPIFESDLGFETGDYILNSAGKALRLLYIQDLRNLQTQINGCIVACQNVTANPKTDTRIGKVGR